MSQHQAAAESANWQNLITVTPGVRSGKPCIIGTRITVYDILEYLAGGMTETEILADCPSLKSEHIRAALAFAAAGSVDAIRNLGGTLQ